MLVLNNSSQILKEWSWIRGEGGYIHHLKKFLPQIQQTISPSLRMFTEISRMFMHWGSISVSTYVSPLFFLSFFLFFSFYIYVCVCVCECVCAYIYIYMYIWLKIIDIFCQHIFFVNPFDWSYDIRRELVDKSSIISYFPSTFCPTLGHHRGKMYYKSDVTFVCTLLLSKTRVCTAVLCSVYFSNLFL